MIQREVKSSLSVDSMIIENPSLHRKTIWTNNWIKLQDTKSTHKIELYFLYNRLFEKEIRNTLLVEE